MSHMLMIFVKTCGVHKCLQLKLLSVFVTILIAMQTNTNTVAFFQSESLPSISFCSFDYARGNESMVHFTDLCKPMETYVYARKKHPFASYPAANRPNAANHPNAANLRLHTYDKNQWAFLITPHGRRL